MKWKRLHLPHKLNESFQLPLCEMNPFFVGTIWILQCLFGIHIGIHWRFPWHLFGFCFQFLLPTWFDNGFVQPHQLDLDLFHQCVTIFCFYFHILLVSRWRSGTGRWSRFIGWSERSWGLRPVILVIILGYADIIFARNAAQIPSQHIPHDLKVKWISELVRNLQKITINICKF